MYKSILIVLYNQNFSRTIALQHSKLICNVRIILTFQYNIYTIFSARYNIHLALGVEFSIFF